VECFVYELRVVLVVGPVIEIINNRHHKSCGQTPPEAAGGYERREFLVEVPCTLGYAKVFGVYRKKLFDEVPDLFYFFSVFS